MEWVGITLNQTPHQNIGEPHYFSYILYLLFYRRILLLIIMCLLQMFDKYNKLYESTYKHMSFIEPRR